MASNQHFIIRSIISVWILSCLVPSCRGDLTDLPILDIFKDCKEPPLECPNSDINFFLYTRNTNSYVLDYTKPETLSGAPFVPYAPIKLIIHGYTGDKDWAPNRQLRPAYLAYQDMNVISVDYSPLVREPCYVQGVHNVPLVGKCTTELLLKLFELRPDLDLRDLHVVGFSLGAQVAGQVGRLMNSTLQRITGLDAASPLFLNVLGNRILAKSDAVFVDSVHTNIGLKGKISPIGHLDFYANNGVLQPGCSTNTSCSHERSVDYFAESINTNNPFYAVKCLSFILYEVGYCESSNESPLIVMGEHVDITQRGIYYFMTNSELPYSRGSEPYEKSDSSQSD